MLDTDAIGFGAWALAASYAIETALHRIDGLSEHFLYLNDDVFLGRPVPPEYTLPSGSAPTTWTAGLTRLRNRPTPMSVPAVPRPAMKWVMSGTSRQISGPVVS